MKKEEKLKEAISTYLTLQYPDVIFRFDIGADIHLPAGLAKKSKRIHKHKKGYPDLFIAEPLKVRSRGQWHFESFGLFIELKATKNDLLTKKGHLRNTEHLKDQEHFLLDLQNRGYFTCFSYGFDKTKEIIDAYMSGDYVKLTTITKELMPLPF